MNGTAILLDRPPVSQARRCPPGSARRREAARWVPSLEELDLELAWRSLYEFVVFMWSTIERAEFHPGWHLRAICAHLEAVSVGSIRRLGINIPPRNMKSLSVDVFWPAWVWLREPGHQFLFSTYAEGLALRDAVRCRRVMQSPRYRALLAYGERTRGARPWVFTGDQNQKVRFDNDAGGYRLSTSVGGSNTGEGGRTIVVDDPHNVMEVESARQREDTIRWWDEAMSTRLSDPRRGAYVLMGQRTHDEDLFGHVRAGDAAGEWTWLVLPARYEAGEGAARGERVLPGWEDPRTEPGDPLWPERYGERELGELERAMTPYAVAAQLQQRPAPREGGMFRPDRLLELDAVDARDALYAVRYWDKSSNTRDGSAQTAGVLMARLRSGMYAVLDVRAGNWDPAEREAQIRRAAEDDGTAVDIYVEQEPGSGGKDSAWGTVRALAGWVARADRPVGDKATRAEPYAAQANVGNVAVLRRGWTRAYAAQLRSFPRGLKDMVDASSGAFAKLARRGGGALLLR